MENITINTKTISNSISKLEALKNYYFNKKNTFMGSSFGYAPNLSSYLNKIQAIYNDISNNVKNVNDYLTDYNKDIEGIENIMSGSFGYVKADNVNGVVNRYKNSIVKYSIDDSNLFEIKEYRGAHSDIYYDTVDKVAGAIATVGMSIFAFSEGVMNVIETLLDGATMAVAGGATLVSNGASVIGLVGVAKSASNLASNLGNFVDEDLSKKWYYEEVRKSGLDRYANPDGTAASISSSAGNILGMIGISVATGGIASSALGSASAASRVMGIAGGVTGALSNMGSEGERALQHGASVDKASIVGIGAAAVGGALGVVSGGLDNAARVAGETLGASGISTIAKNALAAFGVGAIEPLINEITGTIVYRHNDNMIESFTNNFISDGGFAQMLMNGIMNAGGTIGNGIGGILTFNKFHSNFDSAVVAESLVARQLNDAELQIKMNEYNTLANKPGMSEILASRDKGITFTVPDNLLEDYNRLNVLAQEIEARVGTVSLFETNLAIRMASDLAGEARFLTPEEIILKKSQFTDMLAVDSRLERYFFDLEATLLPDDYDIIDKIDFGRRLAQEITNGYGIVDIKDWDNIKLDKISIFSSSSNKEIVTVSYTIDELKNLVLNPQELANIRALDNSKAVDYANALKKLLDEAKVRGIDLGFTNQQMEQAKALISKYGFDVKYDLPEILAARRRILSKDPTILYSNIYEYILSDDFKNYEQMISGEGILKVSNIARMRYEELISSLKDNNYNISLDEFNRLIKIVEATSGGEVSKVSIEGLLSLYKYHNMFGYPLDDKYLLAIKNNPNISKVQILACEPTRIDDLIKKGEFQVDKYFEQFSHNGESYGVDQGVLKTRHIITNENMDWLYGTEEDIFNYMLKKGYDEKTAMKAIEMWETAGNENNVKGFHLLTDYFDEVYDDEFVTAKILSENFRENDNSVAQQLIDRGMFPIEAFRTLYAVDAEGACSYAAIANNIMMEFRDRPLEFKKIFGYDMYRTVDGRQVLNADDLLIDMYTYVNSDKCGNKMFNIYGTNGISINDLSAKQVVLSTGAGVNANLVQSFLDYKKSGLNFTCDTFIFDNNNTLDSIDYLKAIILDATTDGANIDLGIYKRDKEFRFINASTKKVKVTSNTWNEGGGHAVFVTGLSDGGVLVSSWGEKLIIPYEDFLKNRFNININRLGANS